MPVCFCLAAWPDTVYQVRVGRLLWVDENGQIPVLVLPQLLLESERLAMERQTQLIEERKQKAEAELALLDEAHGE